MTYDEAVRIVQTGKDGRGTMILSMAGGSKRYGVFTLDSNGVVSVRLFRTIIARFSPESVTFDRGGWDTATTREAINALMPGARAWASGTDRIQRPWGTEGVWTVYNGSGVSYPFVDGMAMRYDGSVVDESRGFPTP